MTFILALAVISFSQATLQQGSPSFNLTQTTCSPSQLMEGYVNFSLTNEPSNRILEATITQSTSLISKKEMTLLDFLRGSSIFFTCSQNCLVEYTASNPEISKTSLIPAGDKYYGIQVTGMNPQLLNISFKVSGTNSGESVCGSSPLKIDFLDDESIDLEYALPSEEFCSELRGSDCLSALSEESELTSTPYCEKLYLNKSGKVEVAASLKLVDGESSGSDIEFYIYDENGNQKGNCSTDFENSAYQTISCLISSQDELGPTGFFIPEEGNYFVCVKSKNSPTATYSIQKETQQDLCGFYGFPPASAYTEDYAIYAREAKFAPFNDEWIFDSQINPTLLESAQNYINTKYKGDCSLGCVLPLRFISRISQNLALSDIFLRYQPQGSGPTTKNDFYDITLKQPLINLTRQTIPITKINITAPEQKATNYKISLKYNQVSLGSITFKVEPVPIIQSLSPLIVSPGQATNFIVIAVPSEGRQIMNYTWNFNDMSSEQVTTTPSISHAYQPGTYNLVVKATDSSGRTGIRTFQINASLSKESLTQALASKQQAYNSLSTLQIESWYKDLFYNSSQINSTLFLIANELNSTNPDLSLIKSQLDTIKIPVSIQNSLVIPESQYFPDSSKINLQYLSDLGAGTSSDSEATKNAISVWQEDAQYLIGETIKKITYDDNSVQEMTILIIRIAINSDTTSQNYLVLEIPVSPSQVIIKDNQEAYKGFTNALGFNFSESFSSAIAIPSRVEFSSINVYASPPFSSLDIGQGNNQGNGGKSIVLPIIIGILILIAAAVLIYFIWKKKGDSDLSSKGPGKPSNLFENPADEANIIQYVQTSLIEGKTQPEIEQELLNQGWNKKQVDYAFKSKDTQNIEPEQAFNY